jgi:outer membrane protein TolC
MKKSIIFIKIILLFLVNADSVFAEQPSNTSVINELIEEAVCNNPQLQSFHETISLMKETPAQARSLDNPRLKLSIMNLPADTFEFDQEPMTQKQVAIMQKFPFPGKRDLKGSMAEKSVDMAAAEYNEQKNMLIRDVKTVYAKILFFDTALEITEQNRKLLREFVTIVETKYEVGRGIQQDVIKAQLELSKMTDRLITLRQKRGTAVTRLNNLLNRPVQLPFVSDDRLQMTDLALSFEDLVNIADKNRPMLKKKKDMIERSTLSVELAKKNYYPDFDIGASYGQRDDAPMQDRADFVSGFVTLKLPLWYKKKERRKVAESEANVRKVQEEYRSIKNDIYSRINTLLIDIDTYVKKVALFKTGLIPQSRLSLDSALSAYNVNKVDFLTLVSNQINLYNLELEYARAISEHEIKVAELETVIGQRFSGS